MGEGHRTLRLTESREGGIAEPPAVDPPEVRPIEEPRDREDRGTAPTQAPGIAERRERWFRLREEVERRLLGAP